MGFLDSMFAAMRFGRRRHEPQRDTAPYPMFVSSGQGRNLNRMVWKATPRNLRYFSRTPYARRAMNAIKKPIVELEWEIVAAPGVAPSSELERQIKAATYCLLHPNSEDGWRVMLEQLIDDYLVGAAALEVQMGGDKLRPIWLYPTDGLSIQIYPGWTGDKNEARYTQTVGAGTYTGGGTAIQLRDDELIYLRPNPSTSTPFGLGPLEVAFNSISRLLGVGEFAGNLTSNARPAVMLNLGQGVDDSALSAFRSYWTSEVEGQGKMPIMSMDGGEVMRLHPDGDAALYLKYQEFLKCEIATAFDLSPQNLGVERDVNRSTGEVSADRDWDQAIKPCAKDIASCITNEVLHKRLKFSQLQFRFIGLDQEDERRNAEVFEIEYRSGAATPNEYRERRGKPPLASAYADMTGVDFQIAKAAAGGAKRVLDPQLPDDKTGAPAPSPANPEEN